MNKGFAILSVVVLATAVGGANQAFAGSLDRAEASGTPIIALNAMGPVKIGESAKSNDVLDQARTILQNNKKPSKPIKHHIEQRVVERSQESAGEHKLQIMGIDSASALTM